MSENRQWKDFLHENNKDAFSQIYKSHVNELYAYGVSLGFAYDACMDAIQDVFYKFYTQKKKLHHITNIRFYLFRSLRNRLFDTLKHQKKNEPLQIETLSFMLEASVSKQIEDEEERLLLKQKVESLLRTLTDRQREAVYLRYMQSLEYDEIASILEMRADSVRKLVYRALEAIRKQSDTP